MDSFYFAGGILTRLERASPAMWNHFAEKDSRQINILEQVLVAKVGTLWRDLL
jgi:hypothetical protein